MRKEKTVALFTPQWHLDTLESREKKVQESELFFTDISSVKERLKQKIRRSAPRPQKHLF